MTRIAVLYNEPDQRESEIAVVGQAVAIEEILKAAGYETNLQAVSNAAQLAHLLERDPPDVIFNCCESLHARADLEMSVAAFFELFGIPYTGSTPLALGLSLNKQLAKAVLRSNSIPTPRGAVLHSAKDLAATDSLTWPLIVKPVAEDASLGIDREALVYDADSLVKRVQFVVDEFGTAALAEEFIEGREFMVPVVTDSKGEWLALPIAEVPFESLPANHPRIFTYSAKWRVNSPEYRATSIRRPVLAPDLNERLGSLARAAACAVGIRDYGRVDFRMNPEGDLFVIEVNPNPDLNIDSGFFAQSAGEGPSQTTVVLEIVRQAMERHGI